MRQLVLPALAMSALSVISPAVLAAGEPVPVSASALYLPTGFDDNDTVLAVIEGTLPDTCHVLTQPLITRDESAKTVTVTARAWVNPGSCIPTPVPYVQELPLGEFAAGDWRISIAGSDLAAAMPITHSDTSGPDDFIYAPVESARVERGTDGGPAQAVLKGRIFATCLAWKNALVLDQGAVLVVLPILEQTSTDCQPTETEFSQAVELPATLAPGRHLLHVRTLNGGAINLLFDQP